MEPVTQAAAGEARNATMFAMSAGAPHLHNGIDFLAYASSARSTAKTSGTPPALGGVNAFLTPSVGIGPGATAFTRMPCRAHSNARVRVRASMPAFAAVACAMRGQPR